MIINYLKIWFKLSKDNFNLNEASKTGVIYLIYFLIIYFVISHNLILSLVYLLIIIFIKLFIRFTSFYKELVSSNDIDCLLLMPLNPLLIILLYKPNFADILILLPILIYIKLQTHININKR